MRIARAITLSPEQRTVLESQARSRSLPMRVVEHARIVLFAASGQQDKEIAAVMAITPKKVSRWQLAFSRAGRGWLVRHPRFHLHLTPTTPWLNMVERFLSRPNSESAPPRTFRDLEELIVAIGTYIDRHNESPSRSSGPPEPPISWKK
jgi:hypothetical protein